MSTPERPSIRPARLDEILALRHAVLRPGLPVGTARFEGDAEPETLHFGAFVGGAAVGCASMMRRPWPFDSRPDCVGPLAQDAPAWQLRGMATAPDRQRQGIGGRLLERIEAHLLASGSSLPPRPPENRHQNLPSTRVLLWCNARVSAVPFYGKQGWAIASEVFDVPGVGPHYKMIKRLQESSTRSS